MTPIAHHSSNPSINQPPQPLLVLALIKNYDHLVDYVRRRFGNHSFAQDVVQDVCVHVMERNAQESIRIPLALLKRISHDIAVDRCRAEDSRNALVSAFETLPDVASNAPCALRILDAKQELQLLAEAIAALPERCRIVFIMHKVHELPQTEVALQLGISIKTVEKHLRLGMLACRAKLNRQ
jgi:RNA polymerase sigma factor (sigma-70 family)